MKGDVQCSSHTQFPHKILKSRNKFTCVTFENNEVFIKQTFASHTCIVCYVHESYKFI
jgi:hypothetical protein